MIPRKKCKHLQVSWDASNCIHGWRVLISNPGKPLLITLIDRQWVCTHTPSERAEMRELGYFQLLKPIGIIKSLSLSPSSPPFLSMKPNQVFPPSHRVKNNSEVKISSIWGCHWLCGPGPGHVSLFVRCSWWFQFSGMHWSTLPSACFPLCLLKYERELLH